MKLNKYSVQSKILSLFITSCILGSCGSVQEKSSYSRGEQEKADPKQKSGNITKGDNVNTAANQSTQNKEVSSMGEKIFIELCRILFFRRDLIEMVKPFLFKLNSKNIHPDLQTPQFLFSKHVPTHL